MPSESDAPWRHVFLPYYGIGMLLCGLAAGIVGLIAILLISAVEAFNGKLEETYNKSSKAIDDHVTKKIQ